MAQSSRFETASFFRIAALSGLMVLTAAVFARPASAQSLEMKGAPQVHAPVQSLAAPVQAAGNGAGQCRTVTLCAPIHKPMARPAMVRRPVVVRHPVRFDCAPRKVRHVVRHKPRVQRLVEIHTVIERVPVLVQAPPPCPPRAAPPRLPADYSSAIQNGGLVWASRD